MRIVVAHMESSSPYSQCKHYIEPKKEDKESPIDYEKRTWMYRCHVTEEEPKRIFIPPMVFKNCLSEAAKYLGIQIPGKGKQNYTKHFEAGVLVVDSIVLPILWKDVKGEWLFVPPDGKRGGSKRVDKCFPIIHEWKGSLPFTILDDTITPQVFEKHLIEAGKFIGIGRFRPRNNGYYGRFTVKKFEWLE